jgi:hypothetical protein
MATWDPLVQPLYGFLTELRNFGSPIARGVTDDVLHGMASISAYTYTPAHMNWGQLVEASARNMVAYAQNPTIAAAIKSTDMADPSFFNWPSVYVANPAPAHFVHSG